MLSRYFLISAFLLSTINLSAQLPFSSIVKEYRWKYEITSPDPSTNFGLDFLDAINTQVSDSTILIDSYAKNSDLFNSASVGLDLGGETTLPRVKVGFILYKLGVYTKELNQQVTPGKKQQVRYNLPLFVFTRISTQYDSTNVTSSIDSNDYEGSPVTVRLMPSTYWDIGKENQIFAGTIIDYRGLNIQEEDGSNYKQGLYLAGGIRYVGQGKAYTDLNNQGVGGKWSLSLIYSQFLASNEVLKELYDVDSTVKNVGGFQALLTFKVNDSENTRVNFQASYQKSFENFQGTSSGIFKFSIGIN